jgi:hypothetical protein
MNILIQTNNHFKKLQNACIESWESEALLSGFKISLLDYTIDDRNYIENLIVFCENEKLNYIGISFDDLFISECYFPKAELIQKIMEQKQLDYLRLDGRPAGRGKFCITIDGEKYYYISNNKHDLSLVFSFFSLELLKRLKKNDIKSPWDIERFCEKNNVKGISPRKRKFKYNNLLVKDKIDIVSVLESGWHLPLGISLKRFLSRKIKRLQRIVRMI